MGPTPSPVSVRSTPEGLEGAEIRFCPARSIPDPTQPVCCRARTHQPGGGSRPGVIPGSRGSSTGRRGADAGKDSCGYRDARPVARPPQARAPLVSGSDPALCMGGPAPLGPLGRSTSLQVRPLAALDRPPECATPVGCGPRLLQRASS